jgi:hypothetical protein
MPTTNSGIYAARAVTVPGRKLATESAWKRWNRIATKPGKIKQTLLDAVATDAQVQLACASLNGLAASIFDLLGATPIQGKFFELSHERGFAIPHSVWFGQLSLPEAGVLPPDRPDFDLYLLLFRLEAGKLRKRLAVLERLLAVIADLANADDKLNPGGQVGP